MFPRKAESTKAVAVWTLRLILLLVCLAGLAAAQVPTPAPSPHAAFMQRPGGRAAGYLPEEEVPDFLRILPPVPLAESQEDEADVALLRWWQRPENSPRWQLAKADADVSYRRFSAAFGSDIDAVKAPLLVHLLDRVEADVSAPLGQAKDFYHRPRPYQRLAMEHVCGFASAPVPDPTSKPGNSYPSGHTSFGWTAALVLGEVTPDHAQTILARAREYGESRLVCAVHFPSDVQGGELLATAVFARVRVQPEYRRDLRCAQEEHAVVLGTKMQLSPACLAMSQRLAKQP
jgi:acid phosphatase (class A)